MRVRKRGQPVCAGHGQLSAWLCQRTLGWGIRQGPLHACADEEMEFLGTQGPIYVLGGVLPSGLSFFPLCFHICDGDGSVGLSCL